MHLAWLTSMRQSFKETQMKTRNKLIMLNALAAAVALSLSACGGGDDEAPGADPTPTPDNQTLTGQVTRNMTLKNVVVCMDLNANDACDAGEPASAATGEDGRYSLTYDKSAITPAQVAAASLIAPVQTGDVAAAITAIDAANPAIAATSANYVLKRPAGTTGNINPLTTLLHAGVAAGMTEAAARENVALQLGIEAAKIENYQDDPATNPALVQDSARLAAGWIAAALRDGAKLEVGDQKAAGTAAPGELLAFNYFDAGNFYSSQIFTVEKAAGEVGSLSKDVRVLKNGGQAVQAYNSAMLTASGWKFCDEDQLIVTTRGNPNRSISCGAQVGLAYRTPPVALADRAMAEVAAEMAAAPGNTLNNGNGSASALARALGDGKFPAGSARTTRYGLSLTTPMFINSLSTDARSQSVATTLPQLIDAYQASRVNLSNGSGSLSLGVIENANRNLRVAFTAAAADSGSVQYYACDLNDAQTVVSNCAATDTGTYAISTINGARVMQFAGHVVTSMNHTRGYAEVDWGGANGKWLYVYRQLKPAQNYRLGSSNRLNAAAWAALKTQVGI